jgi:hypothetical protein
MKSTFNPLAHQEETMIVSFPVDTVYNAAVRAANSDGFSIKDENRMLRRLTVNTRVSLFSWGEVLHVQVSPSEAGTKITISSQPKTAVGSQGFLAQETAGIKARKNINRFLEALSENV